jgi:hypothetical protein
MEMGVAPVIISDGWVPVRGVDWTFAIFVDESQVRRIDRIVRDHASEWMQRGRAAREAFDRHFANDRTPQNLHAQISRLLANLDPRRERIIRRMVPLFQAREFIQRRVRKAFVSYRP